MNGKKVTRVRIIRWRVYGALADCARNYAKVIISPRAQFITCGFTARCSSDVLPPGSSDQGNKADTAELFMAVVMFRHPPHPDQFL